MSELEEHKIRDYLLSKKLPIDILLEVNDHFISQITELEKTANLDFQSAFEKTKNSWKNELETYFPWYVLNKTNTVARTRFEQKIRNKATINLFCLSFPISLILFLSIYIVAEFGTFNQCLKYFKVFNLILILFCFLPLVYNYKFNSDVLNIGIKKKWKFSIYQLQFPIAFSFGYFGLAYIQPLNIFITAFKNRDFSFNLISQIIVLFILIFSFVFTGFTQIKLAQTLRKIKPHLKFT